MAISQNFPSIAPSLSLNFSSSRTLDPRITFTRTSSATCVGPNGLLRVVPANAPRFDHNPVTGESLGLLVEEQRTNLLLQSENFGTTWTANGLLAFGSGSTLNALAAPDGQTTADLITENTSNSQHNINQVSTTTGAKRFSVFAKQGLGARLLRLVDFNPTDGAQGETYFNLSTGTVVSGPGTIQAFPNGWYRCSIQSTTTATSTYFISIATNAPAFTYTGDGTSGIYIWGAQLEAGAFPTSYIPTTTSTVTRTADVASITGSNFSSWYRQDEGTVFANWSYPVTPSSFPRIWQFTEGAAGAENSFSISTNFANHNRFGARAQNVGLFDTQQGPDATVNQSMRSAMALKAGQHAFSGNGAAPATNTGAMPSGIDRCWIGSVNAGLFLTGHIRRLAYFPTRLSNSILQTLTK